MDELNALLGDLENLSTSTLNTASPIQDAIKQRAQIRSSVYSNNNNRASAGFPNFSLILNAEESLYANDANANAATTTTSTTSGSGLESLKELNKLLEEDFDYDFENDPTPTPITTTTPIPTPIITRTTEKIYSGFMPTALIPKPLTANQQLIQVTISTFSNSTLYSFPVNGDFTLWDSLVIFATKIHLYQPDLFYLCDSNTGQILSLDCTFDDLSSAATTAAGAAVGAGAIVRGRSFEFNITLKYFKMPKYFLNDDNVAVDLYYSIILHKYLSGLFRKFDDEKLAIRLAAHILDLELGSYSNQFTMDFILKNLKLYLPAFILDKYNYFILIDNNNNSSLNPPKNTKNAKVNNLNLNENNLNVNQLKLISDKILKTWKFISENKIFSHLCNRFEKQLEFFNVCEKCIPGFFGNVFRVTDLKTNSQFELVTVQDGLLFISNPNSINTAKSSSSSSSSSNSMHSVNSSLNLKTSMKYNIVEVKSNESLEMKLQFYSFSQIKSFNYLNPNNNPTANAVVIELENKRMELKENEGREREVLEMISGYYLLLYYLGESYPGPLNDIVIPFEPDNLPAADLFSHPPPRSLPNSSNSNANSNPNSNPNSTRLEPVSNPNSNPNVKQETAGMNVTNKKTRVEVFKECYLHVCEGKSNTTASSTGFNTNVIQVGKCEPLPKLLDLLSIHINSNSSSNLDTLDLRNSRIGHDHLKILEESLSLCFSSDDLSLSFHGFAPHTVYENMNFTTLLLNDNLIDDKCYDSLGRITNHPYFSQFLTFLNLENNLLGLQGSKLFATQYLFKNKKLQRLNIAGNEIGNKGTVFICKSVKFNSNLKSLHFDRNSIFADCMKLIGSMMSSNFNLTEISLAGNKHLFSNLESLKNLNDGFSKNKKTLKKLDVNFTGKSWGKVTDKTEIPKNENSSKSEASSSKNEVSSDKNIQKELNEFLECHLGQLESFKCAGCESFGNLPKDGFGIALQKVLSPSSSSSSGSQLLELDVSGTSFGSNNLKLLSQTLMEAGVKLQRLNLGYNTFDKNAGKIFVECIGKNRSLVELKVRKCGFKPGVWKDLLKAVFESNTTLKSLDLGNNGNETGFKKKLKQLIEVIEKGLKGNSCNLEQLNLSSCFISTSSSDSEYWITAIIKSGIENNSKLKTLVLDSNYFYAKNELTKNDKEGGGGETKNEKEFKEWKEIGLSVGKNKTLEKLELRAVGAGIDSLDGFGTGWKANGGRRGGTAASAGCVLKEVEIGDNLKLRNCNYPLNASSASFFNYNQVLNNLNSKQQKRSGLEDLPFRFVDSTLFKK